MQRNLLPAGIALLVCGTPAIGQMHKVAAPEDVVRAVGVYEWTGDRAKPTASRLIPVTVFIDGTLQDGGIYLARPVPFALDTGTIYEVDEAGKPEGTVNLAYASHLRSPDLANNYDDGWFGYGNFVPPPAQKKVAALKESKTPAKIEGIPENQAESDRPTFVRRHPDSATTDTSKTGGTAASSSPAASGTGSSTPASADDPDRPHLTKRSDSSASADSSADKSSTASAQTDGPATPDKSASTASVGTDPANDPDRPTLKKRTPEEAKKARKEAEQSSATGLATSLNDDPNRPTLHHGKGEQGIIEIDFPKLKGIPPDLHQAVAVSDAKTRPAHDFSRPWADAAERATILAKMQAIARAQIAAYASKSAVSAASTTANSATRPATSHAANSKLRHAKIPESPSNAVALVNEQLNGYTLSYGGAATYVYTAQAGDGTARQYVTIAAQTDAFGGLQPAIQSVTDPAHLDRTPWMRLVDVVDPDASNRASLLFELRGESSRQFALYRVIAARSEQIFLTGTTQ